MTFPSNNTDFLNAVFGETVERKWICSFRNSPNETPNWSGRPFSAGDNELSLGNNNYFSVAELSSPKRVKANFLRMAVLVLDDADATSLPVMPNYIIETSPGKHQVGFILSDTVEARDPVFCTTVLEMLSKSGHISADKSGNNIVRYVRLPFGTNTKLRPSGPFQHVLKSWNADTSFDLMQLAVDLGVDLTTVSKFLSESVVCEEQRLDVQDAIKEIILGEVYHDNLIRLAGRFVSQNMKEGDIVALLNSLMDASDGRVADPTRWEERRLQIPSSVRSAALKYGNKIVGFSDDVMTNPEPINLFPEVTGAIPVWDADDYPKVIADLANDVSIRIGVDPVIPAWTMISVATGLIHDRHALQVKAHDSTWRESARLWIALVGDPSTKKTPGMNAVLGPISKLQSRWHSEWEKKMEDWTYKAAEAQKAKRPPPPKPQPVKAYVNDTTLEALAMILQSNKGGILSIQDELSGWFGSMDAYRGKSGGMSKDRPAWLTAYNGGPHFIDRVGQGPRRIENFSIGIIGGIQPDPMRKIASQLGDEDGLLQRFIPLVVQPASVGSDVEPNWKAIDAWSETCDELASGDAHDLIRLHPDAQAVIDEGRRVLQSLGRNPAFDNRLKSALQKAEGQLARLLLTFHMIENRDAEGFAALHAPSDLVSKATAEKTWRLFLRFVVPNIVSFYQDVIGSTEELKLSKLVAGYILTHPGSKVSARDLYRAHGEFRDKEGRALLERIMNHLEYGSWVVPEQTKFGKGPNTWYVNPRVHTDFKDAAEREKNRREEAKLAIQEAVALSRLSLKGSAGS